ncbi:hypothetical protein C2S52_011838 [Perilla frutescens var. hirtella]|nr:hypothetical protein C2S52_011838 [Perilla frutescens var. hirtella]
MARMGLKYIGCDGYSVGLFEERHSHSLIMDTHKEFMNLNRNIDPSHQRFILNCARADPISRRNFSLFGDVVLFDATYRTNRYSMIFATFTGKDNHVKLVTFGAVLMSGEDAECYSWVLPDTRHRLWMWHIMFKVPDKLLAHIRKNKTFRKRLNSIVWSDCKHITDFEVIWNEIMVEFGLTDDSWFKILYDIREDWVPAYFRDLPMSGLCRTTSISESVNSFYSKFLRSKSNLVEFLMNFDSALDSHRHARAYLDSVDESSMPQLKTPFAFEKHAATVYTMNKFYEVQKEIEDACYVCRVCNISENDSVVVLEVKDGFGATNKVVYNKVEDSTTCSCLKFVRDGMLCCHIFILFKDLKLESIPAKYIVPRWMKSPLINEASDIAKMSLLLQSIRELREGFLYGDIEDDTMSKKSILFFDFYGLCAPSEVEVHPPDLVKTKDSGSRIKSKEEARAECKKKPLRTCKKCRKKCNHDSRNCEKK